ncbi:protein rep [Staphylococcus pseudintermedius]|nr:protein rep [Staphylococcus pseudintermedius]EGQ3431549.1 protein rep [Staphylococcus pseudintermedius]EGQ3438898.1 protein rep [Staphylococcus pseudintermedius]EGQ3611436.1 protein rep [Staphylococcus pseudintermedius]EGQ3635650.1 protein rep [Staphylococcus pseudintermedius]
MFKYKKISKNLIGFMCSTEVTVNKNDGSYNQHMHILLCVENVYFRKKKIKLRKLNGAIYGKKHYKLIIDP